MPEDARPPSIYDFAEYAARALDGYQDQFVSKAGLDHRTNEQYATELLADLLGDLMHYAQDRGVDFESALDIARQDFAAEQATETKFLITSPVRLVGRAAQEATRAGLPTCGMVTGILLPEKGPTDYYVRGLGDSRSHRFIGDDLTPGAPFTPIPTYQGIVEDPLAAEVALINATARVGAADNREMPPRLEDIEDHHVLLSALATWNAMDQEQVSKLIYPKVSARLHELESALDPWRHASPGNDHPTPAQLAAQDFPTSVEAASPESGHVGSRTTPPQQPNRTPRAGSARH
ncbi:hypothetical protein [Spirillospora sp. NPDC047279]|uniref:hypothetical protein n=1 Tax=Spirillospora sp. NPDC047279 TaxID=3155478 RepID=UPI00340019B1